MTETPAIVDKGVIARAQGGLLTQLADGGRWTTLAGQSTDDSEMALAVVRTLVAHGTCFAEETQRSCLRWLESDPFDVGFAAMSGVTGRKNEENHAKGAPMRVSPLGILGACYEAEQVAPSVESEAATAHLSADAESPYPSTETG